MILLPKYVLFHSLVLSLTSLEVLKELYNTGYSRLKIQNSEWEDLKHFGKSPSPVNRFNRFSCWFSVKIIMHLNIYCENYMKYYIILKLYNNLEKMICPRKSGLCSVVDYWPDYENEMASGLTKIFMISFSSLKTSEITRSKTDFSFQ